MSAPRGAGEPPALRAASRCLWLIPVGCERQPDEPGLALGHGIEPALLNRAELWRVSDHSSFDSCTTSSSYLDSGSSCSEGGSSGGGD
ncbi:protein of unknown function [Methylorubrum extorquens]|uniref:Uncharacterized protein n=1 Tax=Methylorubrum extorquens TaxID=408 RepID=A0A2N9AXG7_METEX|nr:protein of unknown function [Methylorubrum extorquens]